MSSAPTSFGEAHAGPSVRKLARELGVDLGRVSGSGAKGRVTADDVKAFVKEVMLGGAAAASALPAVPTVDFAKYGRVETEPLSRIQKISGPRLHASWVNVPHVTQHDEADITELEEKRAALKEQATERGIKLTPLAFIVRACALALAEMPLFKSSLAQDGESLVLKHYTHIGFAADTPQGLVVPVIRDADKKDLYEIAKALAVLSDRARTGKLQSDDIQGGVFTISSLGGIGGRFFTPIINAPEVAILGVSRSSWQPVYRDLAFVPRLMLPLSLSYDHRVIDGAKAVRFTDAARRDPREPRAARRGDSVSTVEVRIPELGDFPAVDVIEVLVKPGDRISAEDPLVTLETDKATMDVPAPRAGTVVSVAIKKGDKVSAGDLVLTLEATAEAAAEAGGARQGSRCCAGALAADPSRPAAPSSARPTAAATPTAVATAPPGRSSP